MRQIGLAQFYDFEKAIGSIPEALDKHPNRHIIPTILKRIDRDE
jgi:hypothetical protein